MTPDLAIVGGGVIGSFVLHEALRMYPGWRVLLLERSAIGAGATAWSAGVSFPLAATPEHRALVRASAIGYARLRDTPAGAFVRPVQMIYVTGRDRLDALHDRVVDAQLRAVSTAERQRMDETLHAPEIGADEEIVTHDGHGFAVLARPLAEALVAMATALAEVQLGQHVTAVVPEGDGYRLIAEHGQWSARRVVLTTGPWALPAVPPMPLPAARRKRIAALYARLPVHDGDPLVYFLDDDLFFLPLATGSALASFYRDEWDTDPDACDGRPSEDDLRLGRAVLYQRSARAAGSVTGGRAFCDLYTENRLPVVTAHPDLPGIAAIRGGSGSGVRLAPALAARALHAVTEAAPHPSVPDRRYS